MDGLKMKRAASIFNWVEIYSQEKLNQNYGGKKQWDECGIIVLKGLEQWSQKGQSVSCIC